MIRSHLVLCRGRQGGSHRGAKCYGYARVSTLRQADEGESLETQQRVIAGYATMHDLQVEKVFVERAGSGSKPLAERPEGAALLALLKPGDVVITPRLDRMFRSALDALAVLGKLKTAGISMHMADLGGDTTGNGVSKLVFTMLSAVAEAERDRTRERIAEVKADQRRRGRFLGGSVPFGWRRGGENGDELVPVRSSRRRSKECGKCARRDCRCGRSATAWRRMGCDCRTWRSRTR